MIAAALSRAPVAVQRAARTLAQRVVAATGGQAVAAVVDESATAALSERLAAAEAAAQIATAALEKARREIVGLTAIAAIERETRAQAVAAFEELRGAQVFLANVEVIAAARRASATPTSTPFES